VELEFEVKLSPLDEVPAIIELLKKKYAGKHPLKIKIIFQDKQLKGNENYDIYP